VRLCASKKQMLTVLLVMVAALSAVSAPAQDQNRVVRVGLFQLQPIIFRSESGQAQGLYVDLLEKIASREHWQLQYVDGTWAEGLQRVRDGEIDLMTAVIPTEERDEYLDFPDESVMMVWGQVFARRDARIQNILDLEGQKVAIMKDDLNGRNFQENARKFGLNCEIIAVGSHRDVFELTKNGAVAGGVAPNIFGYTHATEFGLVQTPVLFDPNSITFAATSGRNADLLEIIGTQLAAWKQDEDSYYYQTLSRWFGQGGGNVQAITRTLVWTLAGVGLCALLLLLWNGLLDRRVKARTLELQNSEAKIRAIFDQTFLFLGVLDLEGRLQEVNRNAVEFIGSSTQDVIGLPFWECPWWNHDPRLQEDVKNAVMSAMKGRTQSGQATHPDRSGARHKVEYTIKPIFDEAGEVVMLITEGQDVTEKERLEMELRQSQRMEAIGTLAGGVAHDFNNILTAIMGFNELAQDSARNNPEIHENLKEISLAAVRARDLVQQILTFSRRREAQVAVFHPADVVTEAVKLLRSSLPTTISINQEIHAGSPILADPTQIHQIVMNLGTNAFHAMEQTGGELEVTLRDTRTETPEQTLGGEMPPGHYVMLEVKDTGIGMDAAMLDKIFEPYFTSKEAGKGTGLGLSVVHGIIKSSQGFLRVQSQLGKGTSFQIFLPANRQEPLTPSFSSDLPVKVEGTESILFVDDEVSLTGLAAKFFSGLGYRIQVFNDSFLAWSCFQENPDDFDIIITDQTMPRITGLELIERIRAHNRETPVILCTGDNAGIESKTLDRLAIQLLLQKPLVMKDLARHLRDILGPKRPQAPAV
jgi:PAS domain S-box-containing protein